MHTKNHSPTLVIVNGKERFYVASYWSPAPTAQPDIARPEPHLPACLPSSLG